MRLVLDAGAISYLTARSSATLALIEALHEQALWPPLVPSVVLIECLTGNGSRDAGVNRLLRTCDIVEQLPIAVTRRAALLRAHARRGSTVDALVVATAEPGGAVLTGDVKDLGALASHARGVSVHRV